MSTLNGYEDPYADPQRKGRAEVANALMMQQNGMPTFPQAPMQPPVGMAPGMRGTIGGAAGGAMMGGVLGGPVGSVVGGLGGALIGGGIQRARMGTPSQGAQNAMAGGWDGFSGGGTTMPPAPTRGSYTTPMDPHQAALARGQKSLDAERRALAESIPQNLGQGIEALGSAFNIAMRQRAQSQAAADPWSGMRQTTTAANSGGGFDLGAAFKKLFG